MTTTASSTPQTTHTSTSTPMPTPTYVNDDTVKSMKISSPYIHISECYTGSKKQEFVRSQSQSLGHFRDSKSRHRSLRSHSLATATNALNKSFQMDLEETLNSRRSPRPSRGAVFGDPLFASPEEVTVSSLRLDLQTDLVVLPPDRPPKPAHLIHFQPSSRPVGSFENYANSVDMEQIFSLNSTNDNNTINNNNNINNKNNNKVSSPPDVPPAPVVSRDLKPGEILTRARSQPSNNQTCKRPKWILLKLIVI